MSAVLRVAEARLFRLGLPLVHEFETSSHRKSTIEHILIRLLADDGTVAWGEIASPSDPYFTSETVETCWHIATRYLLPSLLNLTWEHPEQAVESWAEVRGNNFAKAGVDAAVWALFAQSADTSLAEALGGTQLQAAAGVSLGIERNPEELLKRVRTQVEAGYRRIKLKIRPGWDLTPVSAVRAEFPDISLQVDANGAYTEDGDNLASLRELDSYGLAMIEQPFAPRELLAHARLQSSIETPICLDESIETIADLTTAIDLDAARVINIKVSRMGGLTVARDAHDVAFARNIPVWCGGMHEFGVGRAANLALCSLPGFTLPSDVSGSAKYYARDIITEPIVASYGIVDVPRAKGLGREVDEAFVTEQANKIEVLTRD